jgi:tetratricopeptide (TPR) repeat protein
MNKEQYTNWIKNADISTILSIASEIDKYPYCMLFHLIRSIKINTAENKAMVAVLHPNRKRLSQEFMVQKVVKKEIKKENKEDIVKNAAAEFRNKDDLMEILNKRLAELKESSSQIKEKAEPIHEPKSSVSLDELVEKFNKIPPKISLNPENLENEKQYKDLGKSSVFERTNIVSETLAELYLKQGAHDKAIKIYEALKLKYPEKNVTFAKIIKSINDNKK